MSENFQKNLKRVLLTAVVLSFVLSLFSRWIFEGDWPFIPFPILAGLFIAFVQEEKNAKNFIINSIIGSLVFGILASLFIFLQFYITLYFSQYPMPFSNLWEDSGRLIITTSAIVLSFLGALAGIVLKGFYKLYKNKLDKVIIILGPLLMCFFSLLVAKVKYGGTLMSIYYGWPYPLLIHQIKDVIDGFLVNKWILSLGSLYHYFIFDYLFYLIIFVFVFSLVRIINYKKKILNSTFVLFGFLILGIISFTSYLPLRQNYISNEIIAAGYCEINSDCIAMDASCPFGCYAVVNKDQAIRIDSLIKSFPSSCVYGCIEKEAAKCIEKKCSFE